eukprot:4974587-Alexandrium_andersonii.AAC.1
MVSRADQPTRPAGAPVRGKRVGLAVQRLGNDLPIHNPAVHDEPRQRPFQQMVLLRAAQPATAGSVVGNRPAVARDGDAGPGTCSLQQQLNGEGGSPGLSHD